MTRASEDQRIRVKKCFKKFEGRGEIRNNTKPWDNTHGFIMDVREVQNAIFSQFKRKGD